jgi:hypothetical protein
MQKFLYAPRAANRRKTNLHCFVGFVRIATPHVLSDQMKSLLRRK